MQARLTKKKSISSIKGFMVSALLGFILLYFVFHALNGNHGVYALFKEKAREDSNALLLANLQEQRAKMEYRVHMIGSEALDLDLLDEQARRVLGYTSPDELIYILED